ncbi:MAG: DUF2974 domain-containing protein [Acholeplasmatales bacterium]|nr:DUF2974 domain-containing protein [Acholeplasmatales bacterium]
MFKVDELLLLENLTYFSDIAPLFTVLNAEGLTVREYLDKINFDELIDDKDYASYMTGFDFKNLILAMRKNKNILNCEILEPHFDQAYGGGGGLSVVFINDELKEAIVAFRGTALNEWTDDFLGANQIDSLQQINALEWYKMIHDKLDLSRYHVTLTGHSKGGNKAKYITILNDTVERCVSFDGQGFSDKFFENYKKEISTRQKVITNHNVDYDYVNILMNDIGERIYYYGFDYGRGGFAESHCPNTFFDFKENGEYEMVVNPYGQSPEMQILDQFFNSLIRSAVSDKERSETNELLGMLVEKAFKIGVDDSTTEQYVSFLCDMVGDPKYSDNTAFLLTYIIKYSQENKGFLKALKDIMTHFNAQSIVNIIQMVEDIVNSKKLNRLVNLSNFLVLHLNRIVVKKIQSTARKKYNINLTKEQIKKVLIVISMVKGMLKTLEINTDGSDLVIDDYLEEQDLVLPENLNVVVLAGGLSNERNISLYTGYMVSNALKNKGHNVILLDSFMGYEDYELVIEDAFSNSDKYSLKLDDIPKDVPDLWAVKKRRVDQSNSFFGPNVLQICRQADIVFIALHGANGENGKVQSTFDLLGIDYTGNDYFSSAISSNKIMSKQILVNNDIPVPKGYIIEKNDDIVEPSVHNINYPVIVKPNNGGIGLGVSIATEIISFKKALKEAFRWESSVIVEEYVSGREFKVSTINGKAMPVLEVLPLNTADSSTGKRLSGSRDKKCPANISAKLAKVLMQKAEVASACLGLKAYSKVDFIVRNDESFVCLECDSHPHLNSGSDFITEANEINMSFDEVCVKILELSLLKN